MTLAMLFGTPCAYVPLVVPLAKVALAGKPYCRMATPEGLAGSTPV